MFDLIHSPADADRAAPDDPDTVHASPHSSQRTVALPSQPCNGAHDYAP
ncbi:hypothetical protein [Streptomyces sp. NPDC002540]